MLKFGPAVTCSCVVIALSLALVSASTHHDPVTCKEDGSTCDEVAFIQSQVSVLHSRVGRHSQRQSDVGLYQVKSDLRKVRADIQGIEMVKRALQEIREKMRGIDEELVSLSNDRLASSAEYMQKLNTLNDSLKDEDRLERELLGLQAAEQKEKEAHCKFMEEREALFRMPTPREGQPSSSAKAAAAIDHSRGKAGPQSAPEQKLSDPPSSSSSRSTSSHTALSAPKSPPSSSSTLPVDAYYYRGVASLTHIHGRGSVDDHSAHVKGDTDHSVYVSWSLKMCAPLNYAGLEYGGYLLRVKKTDLAACTHKLASNLHHDPRDTFNAEKEISFYGRAYKAIIARVVQYFDRGKGMWVYPLSGREEAEDPDVRHFLRRMLGKQPSPEELETFKRMAAPAYTKFHDAALKGAGVL